MNELVDPKAIYFSTYNEAKSKIELGIKLPQVVNKGRKRVQKLLKGSKKIGYPLMLTKKKVMILKKMMQRMKKKKQYLRKKSL